jgi:hypothetical protein
MTGETGGRSPGAIGGRPRGYSAVGVSPTISADHVPIARNVLANIEIICQRTEGQPHPRRIHLSTAAAVGQAVD